jgi:transposase-like protein
VEDIRRATRRQYTAEKKVRLVIAGFRDEESLAELSRKDCPDVVQRLTNRS